MKLTNTPTSATAAWTLVMLAVGLTSLISFSLLTQAVPRSSAAVGPTMQTREELKPHTQEYIFFYSQIFRQVDRSRVSFSYAFEDHPIPVWLGFATTNDYKPEILVSHPLLIDLPWPFIDGGEYVLYQRDRDYQTIEDFLASPPDLNLVMIDRELTKIIPELTDAIRIQDRDTLAGIDYILTTYRHRDHRNGVYFFQDELDATTATSESSSNIQWIIKNPAATESNSLLLGNINVNYIQI